METEQRRALLKILHFLWLGFGILDGLIVLRVLLKVVADNPQHPLARLIYEVTGPFLAPFAILTPPLAAEGMALEIHSIFAVFAYPLISVLVERLIWNLSSRPKVRPGRGKPIMRTHWRYGFSSLPSRVRVPISNNTRLPSKHMRSVQEFRPGPSLYSTTKV